MFAVGGPLGNPGLETLAYHFDGAVWRDLKPMGNETFWWVHAVSASDVWMVGTEGRIAHWNGTAFTRYESGTKAMLWGVWAASSSDAWAVGGTPGEGTSAPNDLVLHWDGARWSKETLPEAPLGRSLFKVWGTASDNLYVVGEAGTIWHRAGTPPVWTLESKKTPLATGTLFTVSGCSASEVYAVGGADVLAFDGARWQKQSVDLSSAVNGVACSPSVGVTIVGFGGLKQRRVAGKWIDEFAVAPFADFHAAWSAGGGEVWVAGGDFTSRPAAGPRAGVIARFGPGSVSTELPQ
ncbi:MAG: hypothetical protein NVS3B20_15090 [Polyangiales bacterium]